MPSLNFVLANGHRRIFALRRSVVVGRDPFCDIRMQDPLASRQHALFYLDSQGRCYVCDLQSLNGIYVGDAKVSRASLADGAEVRIGNTRIQFIEKDLGGVTAHPDDSALATDVDEQTDPMIALSLDEMVSEADGPTASLELRILYRLSRILRRTRSQDTLFERVVELARETTDPLQVLLLVLGDDSATPVASYGWPPKSRLQASAFKGFLQRIVREGRTFQVPNAVAVPVGAGDGVAGGRALLCVPMESPNKILGAIFFVHRHPGSGFNQRQMRAVSGIGLVAGVVLENLQLYNDLESEFFGTLEALANSLDTKDPYTAGHSRRVASLSLIIAKQLASPDVDIITLRLGALLHDIGKIGVDDSSLRGKGKLTDEEYLQIKQHPIMGDRILSSIGSLTRVRQIVRHHHERWDGRGYPDHLAGEDIPLLARIVGVADSVDAMISNRSYRQARPMTYAMEEVRRCSGTQFDPQVAEATLQAFNAGLLETGHLGFGIPRIKPGEAKAGSTVYGE